MMLFLGAISYGQAERAVVTEYTNSAGDKIFLHKNAASTPSGRCEFGALPRFDLTGQYDMISGNVNGVEILRIDPNVRNASNIDDQINYRWVSEADRTAFRNDITEGRDRLSDANRYRTRDGALSIDTPCGTISTQAYFEAQPNYVRTDGNDYFFGPRGDVRIESTSGSFLLRFGAGFEETFTDAEAAITKLRELYAYTTFEQDLIARGFVESSHHTYEWEQICPGSGSNTWNWRVDIEGNRVNLWSVQTSTALDLSFTTAIQRIDARRCYPDGLPEHFHFLYPDYTGTQGATPNHRNVGNGILVTYANHPTNPGYSVFVNDVMQDIGGRSANNALDWLRDNYDRHAPIEVTEIRGARFSGGGDGHEILSFNYSATRASRFRVWIVDVGSGSDVPVRLVSFGDYYEFDGSASRPISITIPEREVGNAYEIRMAAVSDLDIPISQETPIVGGTKITNINSDRVEFLTASNDLGGDVIWLDRFHRGDTPGRSQGRFKTGATGVSTSAGGKIRRYVVRFSRTDLYTYEGVQVNAQRGAQSNRHDRALNGPTIEYTWRNAGAQNNDDAWINIQWRVNLPPGWSESGLSNYQIRIWSRDNGVNRIHLNNAADSRSEFLSGNNTWGGGITHRYADNDWELGVGVNYNGRTYRIKIVDNVGHGEHNGGNRPRNGDRTGGVTNSIGGVPINRDHSGTSSTHGGHRPGSINFNDGW